MTVRPREGILELLHKRKLTMAEPDRQTQKESQQTLIERQLRKSIGPLALFSNFISLFLIGMLAERTVSLPWIADAMPTNAEPESNLKRINRFLCDHRLTTEAFALAIAAYLPQKPWILIIDRTNWFWGKNPINLFVLSVLVNGDAIPLIIMPLERDGASNTEHRKTLLGKFIELFGTKSIEYVTADREFIGEEWIKWLLSCKIPFRIRLRNDDLVTDQNGTVYEVACLFKRSNQCRKPRFLLWGSWVYLGGKPLGNGKWLVIASDAPGNLLEDYRRRWKIECLFQALKERGFQLEDTRLTLPSRLCALMGLVSLGYLWCLRVGQTLPARLSKSLSRPRQSAFRRGLRRVHRVAQWLAAAPKECVFVAVMQAIAPCRT